MKLEQTDRSHRLVASAGRVAFIPLSALLVVGACNVTCDRGTEVVPYAPRPLKLINGPNDYYPDASKRAGETGEVILHFRIGADGTAQEPFIVDEAHSTSAPRLIKAAKQLFQRSRYEIGESYRHEVTASVLFEIMPCGKLKQESGHDYYYNLCIPPFHPLPSANVAF